LKALKRYSEVSKDRQIKWLSAMIYEILHRNLLHDLANNRDHYTFKILIGKNFLQMKEQLKTDVVGMFTVRY
jgi:hypothetical protein